MEVNDRLSEVKFYQLSIELWDEFWGDSAQMMNDVRGREIVKQLTRSVYSISANIEEGYGRGFGKEYPQYLRFARGSARESKGGYIKSKHLLSEEIVLMRVKKLDFIISMLNASLKTLESKQKTK